MEEIFEMPCGNCSGADNHLKHFLGVAWLGEVTAQWLNQDPDSCGGFQVKKIYYESVFLPVLS